MPLTFLPYTSLNDVLIKGGIPFLSDKMAEGISHHRVAYLNEYLEKLGAKTAIVEHQYIDAILWMTIADTTPDVSMNILRNVSESICSSAPLMRIY